MNNTLPRNTKRVLRILLKVWKKRGDQKALDGENILYNKYFNKKLDYSEFRHSLGMLTDLELMSSLSADNQRFVIRLTTKGETYFLNLRREIIYSALNGLIFPMIVAFFTALVTTLLVK